MEQPLPLSEAVKEGEREPSPHLDVTPIPYPPSHGALAPNGSIPIHARFDAAVGRILPALETTLASLAAGSMHPRHMEQAARAIAVLTRTLRQLNELLAQYRPPEPKQDTEALRASLARKLEAIIAERDEETPRRYLAGWQELEADADAPAPQEATRREPEQRPRIRRF